MKLLAILICGASAVAQNPSLSVTPAVRAGGNLTTTLTGGSGRPYLTYADLTGGPVRLLGVDLFLGLTPGLTLLDAGTLGAVGSIRRRYAIPLAGWKPGVGLYFQSALADAAAPNGMFRVTDGETAILYKGASVMAEKFDNAAAAGFTGSFDAKVSGRLMARAVTRRQVTYRPPLAAVFGQPILGDLNPGGVRIQKVYRAVDLGATGEPEVLTALAWEVFQGKAVANDIFPRMVIDVSNSGVIPNYAVNPGSAFPQFPASGLAKVFRSNRSGAPVRIHDGPYAVQARALSRGFMPYPKPAREFVYDGRTSLLLDFGNFPSQVTKGVNGQQVYLMITSSPRPDARVFKIGSANPLADAVATTGDNAQTGMRFEFARVFSNATSPWRKAPVNNPNYHQPHVGSSVPAGASIAIEYRGARAATGAGNTPWSSKIDVADRLPFLQYRITFRATVDGARPSLDALVIPIN